MPDTDFDLLTATARNNPYPVLDRLRHQQPVAFSPQLQAWIVTGYADVRAGLATATISADRISPRLAQFPERERDRFAPLYQVLRRWPLMLDHAEHARLRAPITRAMTPATVAAFRALIRDTARTMLSTGIDRGGMDIMAELALPLPLTVTSRILGVPDEAVSLLKRCAVDIVDFFGAEPQAYLPRAATAMDTVLDTRDLLLPLVRDRRQEPRQDLLSTLAGDPALNDDDIVAICLMMVFAGFETTSNLIANGILLLLRHPDQFAAVRQERELIRGAVREALRYESPVQRISRLTTRDITLRDARIDKGSLIYFHAGAANRDPRVFGSPDTFNIRRNSERHLAFGYSVHACPGSTLAQAEAGIVLDELCRLAPTIRLTEDPIRWRTNLSVRSVESLRVTFP